LKNAIQGQTQEHDLSRAHVTAS